MAKLFDPHKYGFAPSASARSKWRDMNETGVVHGLPSSRGKAIATNGILVVIERGQDYVIGHVANWIKDEDDKAPKPRKEQKPRKHRQPVEEIIFI